MAICKPTVVAAILVLLAACGGGGGEGSGSGGSGDGSEGGSGRDGSDGSGGGGNGNGGGSGPTGPPPIVGNVQSANPGATLSAARQTAANKPRFGSAGSVTQSPNGDAVSASFDGRHVRVSIQRANGNNVAFNSGSHGYGTESGNSLRVDAMLISTDTSVTLAAVTTNWNNADPSNYLAGGYWMHFKGRVNPLEVTGVETGAFVDGPEISGVPTLPDSGRATYTGMAGGFYGYRHGSTGVTEVGDFTANASLTARFFGSPAISGCIGCNGGISVTGVAVDGSGQTSTFSDVNVPVRIRMRGDQISSNNPVIQVLEATVEDGAFSGNVGVSRDGVSVTSSSGSWGGRFSTRKQADDPRLVAGTVGAEWTEEDGSKGAAVGAWFGTRN